MRASPQDLFSFFDQHGLSHQTRWHRPVFTVADGSDLKSDMPGAHTKNLFLKDKDGAYVLVSAHAASQLALNRLHRALAVRRLSFASADVLFDRLGVVPGSVTPFALINDTQKRVRFVFDSELSGYDLLNFHPLTNTATTAMARTMFERFVTLTGHDITRIDFSGLV